MKCASCLVQVEANKDQSLARRIQRLQRFLLDKVHHELLKRRKTEEQGQDSQAAVPQQEGKGNAVGSEAEDTLNASQTGLTSSLQSLNSIPKMLTAQTRYQCVFGTVVECTAMNMCQCQGRS